MNDERAGLNPVHLYSYLVKAREKLLDWVRPLTLDQYTQEFPLGLKTLRNSLVEIPQAEWTYVQRLRPRDLGLGPAHRVLAPHVRVDPGRMRMAGG